MIHKWFTGDSEKINIFLAAGESDVDADLDVVFKDPARVTYRVAVLLINLTIYYKYLKEVGTRYKIQN